MKTCIKLFAMSIIIAGFTYVSIAQQPQQRQQQQQRKDPPSIEQRVKRVIKILSKKIELSDTEKENIETAFTDFYEKVDQELNSGERPERSVMEAYEKDRDDKIKLVLSEEKYEDYLRMTCYFRPQQQQRNNKRNPNAGRPIN